jgi:choline kinase
MTKHNKDYIAQIKKHNQPEDGTGLSIIISCASCEKTLKKQGIKSLLPIGDSTLIEKQLLMINRIYPKAEIILVVGEDADKLKKCLSNISITNSIRYVYNPLYNNANVLYSIGLGVYNRNYNRILIIYDDLLFNKYTLLNIDSESSKLLVDTNNSMSYNEVGIVVIDNTIRRLTYDMRPKWGQICYLVNKELKLLEKCMLKNTNWCMHEAINYIITNGGEFQMFSNSGYELWEINTVKDLEKIKKKV